MSLDQRIINPKRLQSGYFKTLILEHEQCIDLFSTETKDTRAVNYLSGTYAES